MLEKKAFVPGGFACELASFLVAVEFCLKYELKKAVKCDMCKDLAGGPACVRACPTGAAVRLSPEAFVDVVSARLP